MKWKIRRYGRSYIYDKLHRGTVSVIIGLTVIGLFNMFAMTAPIIKKHITESPSKNLPQNNEDKLASPLPSTLSSPN